MTRTRFRIVEIGNPYRLEQRNLLVTLYRLSRAQWLGILGWRPIRYLRIVLYVIASMIGVARLRRHHDTLLAASIADRHGHRHPFTVRDTNSQFLSIYFDAYREAYEKEVEAVIETFLPEGGTFLDIGSNWGHYTFAAALRRNARVVLFEPSSRVFADAVRIRDELGLADKVRLEHTALSDAPGTLELSHEFFESGVASLDSDNLPWMQLRTWDLKLLEWSFARTGLGRTRESVTVRTLDEYELPECDLIKIDAEGAELGVMSGARQTIRRCQPVIVFEHWYVSPEDFQRYVELFDSMQYDLHKVVVGRLDGDFRLGTITAAMAVAPPTMGKYGQYSLIGFPRSRNLDAFFLS